MLQALADVAKADIEKNSDDKIKAEDALKEGLGKLAISREVSWPLMAPHGPSWHGHLHGGLEPNPKLSR